MPNTPPVILYIASQLPALSETFVYREALGLRARGRAIAVASVHPPQADVGDPAVDALAAEAIGVYGPGAATLLRDALAETLAHPGRAVATALLALRDALFARDMPLVRRPKVLWQMLAGLALARRSRSRGVGHIHAHLAHVPTTIAMYAARQLGVAFSFTGHANDLFQQRTLLSEKLRRGAFVACISRWHREFYREIAPASDERMPIVRCGVDVSVSPPESRASGATLKIVAVGRLIPKKGFDLLIRAVGRLVADGRACSCEIVGGGPQEAALRELIAAQSVAESVTLAGAQPHREAKRRAAAADLFVLPCRVDAAGDRDGIPVALMEAMAAGTCVVSGDLPTIRELVMHEQTGLLTPPGDIDALVAALRRLMDDDDLRTRLAAQGRAHVQAEFSDEVNLDRLTRAFDRVASSRADKGTP